MAFFFITGCLASSFTERSFESKFVEQHMLIEPHKSEKEEQRKFLSIENNISEKLCRESV